MQRQQEPRKQTRLLIWRYCCCMREALQQQRKAWTRRSCFFCECIYKCSAEEPKVGFWSICYNQSLCISILYAKKDSLFVSMVEEDKRRRFWWFTEHHDLTSFTFSPSLWGWWWWQSCQQQLCLLDHACDSVKTQMLCLPITMTVALNLDSERISTPYVRGPSKLACFIWLVIICIKRSSFQSWELVHTIAEMFTFANSGNCISCCTPLCMWKFSKCIPCGANLAYENSWNVSLVVQHQSKVQIRIFISFFFCSNLQMWIVRCLVSALFRRSVIYREGFLDVSHVLQEQWCFEFAQRYKQFHTPTHVFLSYCCFSIVGKRRLSCKQWMGCWRVFMLVFIATSIN